MGRPGTLVPVALEHWGGRHRLVVWVGVTPSELKVFERGKLLLVPLNTREVVLCAHYIGLAVEAAAVHIVERGVSDKHVIV